MGKGVGYPKELPGQGGRAPPPPPPESASPVRAVAPRRRRVLQGQRPHPPSPAASLSLSDCIHLNVLNDSYDRMYL
jgi:hypothetical protein